MKKIMVGLLTLVVCFGLNAVVFADELSELKLRAANIQIEFLYTQERQKVLRYESIELEKKIKELEKAKTEKSEEVKFEKVDEVK
jgi:hypothetical protein